MKTHKRDPDWPDSHFGFTMTECGLVKRSIQFADPGRGMRITDEWDDVTCKNCLNRKPKEN